MLRLEPRAATQLILRAHDLGDFAAVRRLAPEGLMLWGDDEGKQPSKTFVVQLGNAFLNALAATFSVAYAEAAAGHGDLARQRLEEVRARLALLAASGGAGAEITKAMSGRQKGGGRPRADRPEPADRARIRAPLIDYKQSRPNFLAALVGASLSMGTSLLGGIERTTGFRSNPNPDGTTTIEYVGATNSGPMVQEMTLLRAAELAREAGKAGFAIVDRKDYQRFMATMQGGSEVSRVPSGYKTELTVRFLEDGARAPAAFDAVAVIDDLGPLYYES